MSDRYHKHANRGRCANCGSPDKKRMPRPGRKTCQTCADQHKYQQKKYSDKIWEQALKAYGGMCACCSEANDSFLTLDHVNSDGAAHRRETGASRMADWAVANGCPDILQLLCWNCNCARYYRSDGRCPHELIDGQ